MSREVYFEIRSHPDDDYVGDLQERPTRQRPTLTRKQAAAVWREEREMMFFSLLMRESTSYRAYITDDLRNATVQERNFRKWSEEIERDRLERERTMAMITTQIEKHKRKNSADNDCAERRQDQ